MENYKKIRICDYLSKMGFRNIWEGYFPSHDDGAYYFELRWSEGDTYLLVSIREGQGSCDRWESTHGCFTGDIDSLVKQLEAITADRFISELYEKLRKAEACIVRLKKK